MVLGGLLTATLLGVSVRAVIPRRCSEEEPEQARGMVVVGG